MRIYWISYPGLKSEELGLIVGFHDGLTHQLSTRTDYLSQALLGPRDSDKSMHFHQLSLTST